MLEIACIWLVYLNAARERGSPTGTKIENAISQRSTVRKAKKYQIQIQEKQTNAFIKPPQERNKERKIMLDFLAEKSPHSTLIFCLKKHSLQQHNHTHTAHKLPNLSYHNQRRLYLQRTLLSLSLLVHLYRFSPPVTTINDLTSNNNDDSDTKTYMSIRWLIQLPTVHTTMMTTALQP